MKELLKHKTNIVIVLSFWEIQSGDEAHLALCIAQLISLLDGVLKHNMIIMSSFNRTEETITYLYCFSFV